MQSYPVSSSHILGVIFEQARVLSVNQRYRLWSRSSELSGVTGEGTPETPRPSRSRSRYWQRRGTTETFLRVRDGLREGVFVYLEQVESGETEEVKFYAPREL
jgi:hypothetical protein